MSNDKNKIVICENLFKIYKTNEIEVVALQGLDLVVEEGEIMAVIGSSGSGKSTLLNMLGGLDHPSAGRIIVDGKDLLKATEAELIKYKRQSVGFVWQNNARNLIPYMTAIENVELPMIITGRKDRSTRAHELLEAVGMSHREGSRLDQLSGGEQQRVAIAIGMANMPKILLADEPTGSVDSKTANQIYEVFRNLNKTYGVTVIIVTHDMSISKKTDRVVAIRDGKTGSEYIRRFDEQIEEGVDTHVEYTVLDQSGRLQIPDDFLQEAGLKNEKRARVEMQGNKILVFKD